MNDRPWTAGLLSACVLPLLLMPQLGATYYFVSPSGSDLNPGTAPLPWQSIAKVNATVFSPGDGVYFQGGEVFTGGIVLHGEGSNQHPIVIASYGSSHATIDSRSQTAIFGYNTGGFRLENLMFTNSGTSGYGIQFFTDSNNGQRHAGLVITNVEIAGMSKGGINIGSWQPSNPGWDFLSVGKVKSHDNEEGMSIYGYTGVGVTSRAIGTITVSSSEFSHNTNSGMVLCGAGGGMVEWCSFHHNQATGGCWTWGISGVTIQHSLSFCNLRGKSHDGFGFDLDGGTQDCTIQYCLSYGNDTPGFVIFDYPQSAMTRNNTIRYCISENDVRHNSEWGSFEIFPWGDTPIDHCSIYNCVAYLTSRSGTKILNGFEGYGRKNHTGYYSGRTLNCSFRNNVIYLDGAGAEMRFLTANIGATQPDQVAIQNNLYYSSQGVTALYYKNRLYRHFKTWRHSYPQQERVNGRRTGIVGNPSFTSVGTANTITSPAQLSSLPSYRPSAGSPCLHQGLNLQKLFGIYPGTSDFGGKSLPAGGPFPIGAFQ